MQGEHPARSVTWAKYAKLSPLAAAVASVVGLATVSPAAPAGPEARPASQARASEEDDAPNFHPVDLKRGLLQFHDAQGRVVVLLAADDEKAGGEKSGSGSDDDVLRRLRERRRAEGGGNNAGQGDRKPQGGAVAGPGDHRDPNRGGNETPRPGANPRPDPGNADRGREERERMEQLREATRRLEAAARERREGEGRRNQEGAGAHKVAFLGVSPSPVPAVLARQLKLPAETGLVVDEVEPGSPAAQAGLKQYDVLQKLDDQVLIDPHQLVVLVRGHKAGESVSLSGVREGQHFDVKVKLAEHEAPEEAEGREGGGQQGEAPELRFHFEPNRPWNPVQPWNPAQPNPGAPDPRTGQRPLVIPLPLAPGASVPPRPNETRPPEAPRPGQAPNPKPPGERRPETRPDAGPRSGGQNQEGDDAQVRRLEEQLRELRAAAEQLRAQVRQREQDGSQPGQSPRGQERNEGEGRRNEQPEQ